MSSMLEALAVSGIPAFEAGFTALDSYLGLESGPLGFALASTEIQDLAKASDNLGFPGTFYGDASIGGNLYLRCVESPREAEAAAFAQLDLLRDPRRNVYLDPKNVYESLRSPVAELRSCSPEQQLFESAILLSRYDYEIAEGRQPELPRNFGITEQRDMLCLMLTGRHPDRGFKLLKEVGFVDRYWPELASLAGTYQSKEFHPEGDAWDHTLETFQYRKTPDLVLSLALLLHDAGKPRAEASEGKQFSGHAELGRIEAERFMRRLEFPAAVMEDVSFLVRYHMLPAALPRLPISRVEGVIGDQRFPLLLDLYKCDELSTFRGPEGYYDACAAYQNWLRNRRNPWRDAEGRKVSKLYLQEAAAAARSSTRR